MEGIIFRLFATFTLILFFLFCSVGWFFCINTETLGGKIIIGICLFWGFCGFLICNYMIWMGFQ
jgi:hypothetical protein